MAVRAAPDEWVFEIVEVPPDEVLTGPPLPRDVPAPIPGGAPLESPPAVRWTIVLASAAGLAPPFEEGDVVWARRLGHLASGAPARESIAIAQPGQAPMLVFSDAASGSPIAAVAPAFARPTASSVAVYTTTGKDERACHRIIEHRAATLPDRPSNPVRPGEVVRLQSEDGEWALVLYDSAVTIESETCPNRRWDRFAWLAVRLPYAVPVPP